MQPLRSDLSFEQCTDPELASREETGEQGAFEFLMRRHNQVLYRVARSIIKDDTEAEDVVQECYLLAYGRLDQFRGEASLSTWLTRIVVNEANGRLRKTRRRAAIIQLVPDGDWSESTGENAMSDQHEDLADRPEESAYRAEARRLIEAQIDALPEILRTVFVLRAVQEFSVGETAAVLGIPEATVRSRFFRARGMLREALARHFDHAMGAAFSFGGERCDRIVKGVLSRLSRPETAT